MHSELNGLASVGDPPTVYTPTVVVDDWGLMMQAGHLGQLMNKHDFFHFLTFEWQVTLIEYFLILLCARQGIVYCFSGEIKEVQKV